MKKLRDWKKVHQSLMICILAENLHLSFGSADLPCLVIILVN